MQNHDEAITEGEKLVIIKRGDTDSDSIEETLIQDEETNETEAVVIDIGGEEGVKVGEGDAVKEEGAVVVENESEKIGRVSSESDCDVEGKEVKGEDIVTVIEQDDETSGANGVVNLERMEAEEIVSPTIGEGGYDDCGSGGGDEYCTPMQQQEASGVEPVVIVEKVDTEVMVNLKIDVETNEGEEDGDGSVREGEQVEGTLTTPMENRDGTTGAEPVAVIVEKSETEEVASPTNGADKRNTRKRMIQSILFPLKPHRNYIKGDSTNVVKGGDYEGVGGEDAECCTLTPVRCNGRTIEAESAVAVIEQVDNEPNNGIEEGGEVTTEMEPVVVVMEQLETKEYCTPTPMQNYKEVAEAEALAIAEREDTKEMVSSTVNVLESRKSKRKLIQSTVLTLFPHKSQETDTDSDVDVREGQAVKEKTPTLMQNHKEIVEAEGAMVIERVDTEAMDSLRILTERSTRRKHVQSTLFSQKSEQANVNGDRSNDNKGGDDGGVGEEYCTPTLMGHVEMNGAESVVDVQRVETVAIVSPTIVTERRSNRRRLVQSTLFPHKSQEINIVIENREGELVKETQMLPVQHDKLTQEQVIDIMQMVSPKIVKERRNTRKRLTQSTLLSHGAHTSGETNNGDVKDGEPVEETLTRTQCHKASEADAVAVVERVETKEMVSPTTGTERRNIRRRLVQSTLFPHKSPQINFNVSGNGDANCRDEHCGGGGDEDGNVEYCNGSQGKGAASKRKRKGKMRIGKTTIKKTASAKKAQSMTKESSGQSEHTNCLNPGGSNLFLKASDKKVQQKQQKEQGEAALQVESETICINLESVSGTRSRLQLKKKHQEAVSPGTNLTPSKSKCTSGKSKGTPSKRTKKFLEEVVEVISPGKDLTPSKSKGTPGKLKGTPSKRIKKSLYTANDVDSQDDLVHEPVDLRLEAKRAAEENARLSTGKQTHPFFSLWKTSKKVQNNSEEVELSTKPSLDLQENKGTTRNFHVFEMPQDEFIPLDWKTWTFCEKTSLSCSPENNLSSVFQRIVKPLTLYDFHNNSDPVETSYIQNEEGTSQCSSQMKGLYLIAEAASSKPPNEHTSQHQIEFLEEVREVCENGSSLEYIGSTPVIDLDSEPPDVSTQERMRQCYLDSDSHVNMESVYEPNNCLWTKRYQPQKSSEVCGNGDSVKFVNDWLYSWHERHSRNLVNSPVRKKSIDHSTDYSWGENDSDTESLDERTNLKNVLLVTGPVGSGKSAAIYACAREQGFHVIEVNASDCRNGAHVKLKFGEAMESFGLNNWSAEDFVGSLKKDSMKFFPVQSDSLSSKQLDDDEVEVIGETYQEVLSSINDRGTVCSPYPNKTLILFEDVDTIFYEDRGFIASIQQIAETAKRPMILTSNCDDPVLPDQLDRLEVCFRIPLHKELLSHACTVCAAEKADIHPNLVERFIRTCRGDIRKTLTLLQFWCQGGKQDRKDGKLRSTHGPVQFDLESGHWMLPKVMDLGCPCPLAELVEKEITRSLSLTRDNDLSDVFEEELSSQKTYDSWENNNDAKKEAMLRKHCSNQDGNFFALLEDAPDFSNCSSPTALSRRVSRRHHNTVLSSQSGDELCNDKFSASCDVLSKDPLDLFVDHFQNEKEVSEEIQGKFFKIESDQRVCDTYRSISCVAESIFVSETEFDDGCTLEAVSLGVDMNQLNKDVQEDNDLSNRRMKSTTTVDMEYVTRDEGVGDSHNDHGETLNRGYQMMDECSRADFSMGCCEPSMSATVASSVQEAWRKLRNCRTELKSHISPEQKELSKIVQLASGMTDLISVSDIMLGCCQPLLNDTLELRNIPHIESDAFWWDHDQLEMTSTFAQHGFCVYVKESVAQGSSSDSRDKVDLAKEMLMSTTNTTAIGKLIMKNLFTSQNVCIQETSETEPCGNSDSLKREVEEILHNTVQSVVPLKSQLALKGAAFHEYLSSLGQISRFENSRLSEGTTNTKRQRRRGRAARHYLSNGPLMFSSEDISLLAHHSNYESCNQTRQEFSKET